MSIVIIDASVASLVVLKHLSAAADAGPVLTFSDPRAALAHLADNDAKLIIVDCVLPHVDGITLVTAVRGNPRHAGTAIVMVTQASEQGVRGRALAAGVTNFLVKPINLQQYKYVVKVALDRARRSAAEAAHAAG